MVEFGRVLGVDGWIEAQSYELSTIPVDRSELVAQWSRETLDKAVTWSNIALEKANIKHVYIDCFNGTQGSGKSTSVKAISQVAEAWSGKTEINDPDLSRVVSGYSNPAISIVSGTGGVMSKPQGEYQRLVGHLGNVARKYSEAGILVPDQIAVAGNALMIVRRLFENRSEFTNTDATLSIDGFPRTREQLQIFESFCNRLDVPVTVSHLMMVPLEGESVDILRKPEARIAAVSFAQILRMATDIDSLTFSKEREGWSDALKAISGGMIAILPRLWGQAQEQGRLDASAQAVTNRVSGFFANTSDLWQDPHMRFVNSLGKPGVVASAVATQLLGGIHKSDLRSEFVRQVGLKADQIVSKRG